MRVPFSVKVGTVAAVLAAAVAPAPAEAAASDVNGTDRAFVEAAGHAGAYEIAAGRLAADRAADSAIRSFGRHMVMDHTEAGAKLQALADDLGVDVPGSPDSVQRDILDIWDSLTGRAFDCSYAPAAYADHVAAVGLFEHEATTGQNSRLRAFARKALPTLREHRGMAAENLDGLSCTGGHDTGGPTWNPGPAPWPTGWPTTRPTHRPRPTPTMTPTARPTIRPTIRPTVSPTVRPTTRPTTRPTMRPTSWPTLWPTRIPTIPPITMPPITMTAP